MDIDENEESEEMAVAPATLPTPVLAPSVKIVKNYDPRQARLGGGDSAAASGNAALEFQTCPRCGVRIPLREFGEHLRIELLDPRWKEQRDRMIQEKQEIESMFASGQQIESSLKLFAGRRQDIFVKDKPAEEETQEENRENEFRSLGYDDDHQNSWNSSSTAAAASTTTTATTAAPVSKPTYESTQAQEPGMYQSTGTSFPNQTYIRPGIVPTPSVPASAPPPAVIGGGPGLLQYPPTAPNLGYSNSYVS